MKKSNYEKRKFLILALSLILITLLIYIGVSLNNIDWLEYDVSVNEVSELYNQKDLYTSRYKFYNIVGIIIFIIEVVSIIYVVIRYRKMIKHSNNGITDSFIMIGFCLIISGIGFISITSAFRSQVYDKDYIYGLCAQIPLILSIIVYNVLKVKYKK